MLALAAAIWGFAFVAQRVGADHVGPLTFSCVRFAIAAVFLWCVIAVRDGRRGIPMAKRWGLTKRALLPGILIGTVLALAGGLQQAGMTGAVVGRAATAGEAAFITGLYMVLVPLVGSFLGHRVHWPIVAGVALAVVGLYLISVTDGLSISLGNVLVLMCALGWTAHILLIDRFSKRLSVLRLAATQFVACAVVSAVLSPLVDNVPFAGIAQAWLPLLYSGLLAGGVAFTLQVVAQRDALAAHASLLMALESVFGALGGALLLGENMGARGYAGAALMVAGIVVSQLAATNKTAKLPGDQGVGSKRSNAARHE
ncbi:MAG: DMT family transporter [Micrococcales bacterium]|nr:DMT family transporter [Micrococcales bacterium]